MKIHLQSFNLRRSRPKSEFFSAVVQSMQLRECVGWSKSTNFEGKFLKTSSRSQLLPHPGVYLGYPTTKWRGGTLFTSQRRVEISAGFFEKWSIFPKILIIPTFCWLQSLCIHKYDLPRFTHIYLVHVTTFLSMFSLSVAAKRGLNYRFSSVF